MSLASSPKEPDEKPEKLIFMVRCGSNNHDLFLPRDHQGIDTRRPPRRQKAGENSDDKHRYGRKNDSGDVGSFDSKHNKSEIRLDANRVAA